MIIIINKLSQQRINKLTNIITIQNYRIKIIRLISVFQNEFQDFSELYKKLLEFIKNFPRIVVISMKIFNFNCDILIQTNKIDENISSKSEKSNNLCTRNVISSFRQAKIILRDAKELGQYVSRMIYRYKMLGCVEIAIDPPSFLLDISLFGLSFLQLSVSKQLYTEVYRQSEEGQRCAAEGKATIPERYVDISKWSIRSRDHSSLSDPRWTNRAKGTVS